MDRNVGPAIVLLAIAVIVYAQLAFMMAPGDWLRHASVVPYFPRTSAKSTRLPGRELARHVAELDEVACSARPDSPLWFGWNDDIQGEPLVWHESATGLKTVNALVAVLEEEESPGKTMPRIIADLKRIAHALERANAQGIPFSLLLRHSTVTSGRNGTLRAGLAFRQIGRNDASRRHTLRQSANSTRTNGCAIWSRTPRGTPTGRNGHNH